jgi:hypothetical protein
MKKGGEKKKRRRKIKGGERGSGRNSKFHCQCESNLTRLGTNLTSSMSFKVLQTLEETWGKGLKGCLIPTFYFIFHFFSSFLNQLNRFGTNLNLPCGLVFFISYKNNHSHENTSSTIWIWNHFFIHLIIKH